LGREAALAIRHLDLVSVLPLCLSAISGDGHGQAIGIATENKYLGNTDPLVERLHL